MSRSIDCLVVHCTASNQQTTIADLQRTFKSLGWKYPGYHYVVDAAGKVHQLLSEEKISNGVKGYNSHIINIAYIGGIDKNGKAIDNRTEAQKESLKLLLRDLKIKYPNTTIKGHRDFSPDLNHNGIIDSWERIKECPCFDAIDEYKYI